MTTYAELKPGDVIYSRTREPVEVRHVEPVLATASVLVVLAGGRHRRECGEEPVELVPEEELAVWHEIHQRIKVRDAQIQGLQELTEIIRDGDVQTPTLYLNWSVSGPEELAGVSKVLREPVRENPAGQSVSVSYGGGALFIDVYWHNPQPSDPTRQ